MSSDSLGFGNYHFAICIVVLRNQTILALIVNVSLTRAPQHGLADHWPSTQSA
jgi:hypothetical protein